MLLGVLYLFIQYKEKKKLKIIILAIFLFTTLFH